MYYHHRTSAKVRRHRLFMALAAIGCLIKGFHDQFLPHQSQRGLVIAAVFLIIGTAALMIVIACVTLGGEHA